MACRDIRELISAFVDGETSAEETALVTEHLSSCARCRDLERGMRAMGEGVRQVRREPTEAFREAVFARLESEGTLPKGKRVPAFPWRWAAVPLAAAAAAALFLLASRDAVRERPVPGPTTARVESPVPSGAAGIEPAPPASGPAGGSRAPARPGHGTAASLSAEDREMIALLDILEDPASFEAEGETEGVDLLVPGDTVGRKRPAKGRRDGA